MHEGDTPPPSGMQYSGVFKTVRSTQRVGMQYADILLYRTQSSIFTLKRSNFQQETQHMSHKKSNNSEKFGVISAFINLNIDLGRSGI